MAAPSTLPVGGLLPLVAGCQVHCLWVSSATGKLQEERSFTLEQQVSALALFELPSSEVGGKQTTLATSHLRPAVELCIVACVSCSTGHPWRQHPAQQLAAHVQGSAEVWLAAGLWVSNQIILQPLALETPAARLSLPTHQPRSLLVADLGDRLRLFVGTATGGHMRRCRRGQKAEDAGTQGGMWGSATGARIESSTCMPKRAVLSRCKAAAAPQWRSHEVPIPDHKLPRHLPGTTACRRAAVVGSDGAK